MSPRTGQCPSASSIAPGIRVRPSPRSTGTEHAHERRTRDRSARCGLPSERRAFVPSVAGVAPRAGRQNQPWPHGEPGGHAQQGAAWTALRQGPENSSVLFLSPGRSERSEKGERSQLVAGELNPMLSGTKLMAIGLVSRSASANAPHLARGSGAQTQQAPTIR